LPSHTLRGFSTKFPAVYVLTGVIIHALPFQYFNLPAGADGEAEADGESDTDSLAEGLRETELLAEGLWEALEEELGDKDAEPLLEGERDSDGLAEGDKLAELLADGLREDDSEALGDKEAEPPEGDADGLSDALGERLADGL
jgi:hypothetical protein